MSEKSAQLGVWGRLGVELWIPEHHAHLLCSLPSSKWTYAGALPRELHKAVLLGPYTRTKVAFGAGALSRETCSFPQVTDMERLGGKWFPRQDLDRTVLPWDRSWPDAHQTHQWPTPPTSCAFLWWYSTRTSNLAPLCGPREKTVLVKTMAVKHDPHSPQLLQEVEKACSS